MDHSQSYGCALTLQNVLMELSVNSFNSLVATQRNQHIAQAYYTSLPEDLVANATVLNFNPPSSNTKCNSGSSNIVIDPNQQLSTIEQRAFHELHAQNVMVFWKSIGMYNNRSGKLFATINMGPVEPPAQKAHLPAYNIDKMRLLRDKMDELESARVLAKPKQVDVHVEYVSPSFLIKKPDGTHRLVTAFNAVGSYAKRIPSQSTSTTAILQFLAGFKYVIKSDMTLQFFQMPMD